MDKTTMRFLYHLTEALCSALEDDRDATDEALARADNLILDGPDEALDFSPEDNTLSEVAMLDELEHQEYEEEEIEEEEDEDEDESVAVSVNGQKDHEEDDDEDIDLDDLNI